MKHRFSVAGGLMVAFLLLGCAASAQVAVQQTGPATRGDGACFTQNGIIQDCGFPPASSVGSCLYRAISTGTTDAAVTTDCTIAWNSAATGAKTEVLFACATSTKSAKLTVLDQKGTAGLYPITIQANGTNKLIYVGVSYSTLSMPFGGQSYNIQCDGTGNWVVF